MLKRIGQDVDRTEAYIPVTEAGYPLPFPRELEFNAPVHGNWNIVHIGMLIPGAHQIYVGSDNCMRGVVMTAAEMNAQDRFSMVLIEEEDILEGNLEDLTIEGISEVIRQMPSPPPAILVFLVCLHHFLGSDTDRIYGELEERFPDIDFIRCWMDPIMQKHGLTPDQKERKAMLDPIPEKPVDLKTVNILGGDMETEERSDLMKILSSGGYKVRELPRCKTYQDYQDMGEAFLNICCLPAGEYGVKEFSRRLNRKYLYLPICFGYDEIEENIEKLCAVLKTEKPDVKAEKNRCEEAIEKAKKMIGDTPIAIDYLVHPRPLGMARMLIEHEFNVKTVYIDAITPEEQKDLEWLKQNTAGLELGSTMHVKQRRIRHDSEEVLAVGPKAAWFEGTSHFVNMVEAGGSWGFDGICHLMERMMEAYQEEKDTRDLVPRKGLGCASCI